MKGIVTNGKERLLILSNMLHNEDFKSERFISLIELVKNEISFSKYDNYMNDIFSDIKETVKVVIGKIDSELNEKIVVEDFDCTEYVKIQELLLKLKDLNGDLKKYNRISKLKSLGK